MQDAHTTRTPTLTKRVHQNHTGLGHFKIFSPDPQYKYSSCRVPKLEQEIRLNFGKTNITIEIVNSASEAVEDFFLSDLGQIDGVTLLSTL